MFWEPKYTFLLLKMKRTKSEIESCRKLPSTDELSRFSISELNDLKHRIDSAISNIKEEEYIKLVRDDLKTKGYFIGADTRNISCYSSVIGPDVSVLIGTVFFNYILAGYNCEYFSPCDFSTDQQDWYKKWGKSILQLEDVTADNFDEHTDFNLQDQDDLTAFVVDDDEGEGKVKVKRKVLIVFPSKQPIPVDRNFSALTYRDDELVFLENCTAKDGKVFHHMIDEGSIVFVVPDS